MKGISTQNWNTIAGVIKEKLDGHLGKIERLKLNEALGQFITLKPKPINQGISLYIRYEKRCNVIGVKPLSKLDFHRTIAVLEELNIL